MVRESEVFETESGLAVLPLKIEEVVCAANLRLIDMPVISLELICANPTRYCRFIGDFCSCTSNFCDED